MASPTDGRARGATQELPSQFLDYGPSQVTQPSEEPALSIPRTLSPEQFSDPSMSSPEQFPAAYTLSPYQVHEPTTASVNAVTADHVTPHQHSAGPLYAGILSEASPPPQSYYVVSSSQYAPSGPGPAYALACPAHFNAVTADHVLPPQHYTAGPLYPEILSEISPPPQPYYATSSPPSNSGPATAFASTDHISATTADHVFSSQHSTAGPLYPGVLSEDSPPPQPCYATCAPRYAPSGSRLAYALTSTAHVSAVTEDHVPFPRHFTAGPLHPGILSDASPPPQLYTITSCPPCASSSSGPVYAVASTSHVSSATAEHVLAPESAEHRYNPPPGPPPQSSYNVSSTQYVPPSSGPAYALGPTAHVNAATADHVRSPQHFTTGPLYPGVLSDTSPLYQPYYATSSPQYAPSGSGAAYALAPTAAVTVGHVFAPELVEHRYQPPPGPPSQSSYAVSSPQRDPYGSGPAYTLASSGVYPSLPAGPSSLLTPTSQPSAVPLGEQHQEIVEESGPSTADSNPESLLSQRQMLAKSFREIQIDAICAGYPGPFIEQRIYVPSSKHDRLRYVTQAKLEPPIVFRCTDPVEDGIHLDTLKSQIRRLVAHNELVFVDQGPSISLRLELEGYESWTAQISTKNYKDPRGPIALAKLAKNIAKHIKRFIEKPSPLEMYSGARWEVGGVDGIKFKDLTLVSLHHVSQGSWQPQLRLRLDL